MQIKTMTRFTWHQSEETASKKSPSVPVGESREKTEVSCSRWKRKLLKITVKTRERGPIRLKTQLPYDRAVTHLAVYLEKTTHQKDTSSPVFNLAPFSFFFFFLKFAQLCLSLCDPMDYTVLGIHQARILEWVAFPFSSGSSGLRD